MIAGTFIFISIIYGLAILHELSHLLVARCLGFQVPIFGVGLPLTPYLTFLKTEKTEFRMHLVPIGAYAVIPELDPQPQGEDEAEILLQPYCKFSLLKKTAVVLSGVIFNFIFGAVLLIASLMILGKPAVKLTVEGLSDTNFIARDAGVLQGDEIAAVDTIAVSNPEDVTRYISTHRQQPIILHLNRSGKKVDCSLVPNADGRIGMLIAQPVDDTRPARRLSFSESISECGLIHRQLIAATGEALKAYLSPNNSKLGKSGPASIMGPAGAIYFMADKLKDARTILYCAVMLSFDFGLLNLLPLPGLDGGHFISVVANHFRKRGWSTNRPLRWLRILGISLLVLKGCYAPCLLSGSMPRKR
jgi:regulator of sigma E protease